MRLTLWQRRVKGGQRLKSRKLTRAHERARGGNNPARHFSSRRNCWKNTCHTGERPFTIHNYFPFRKNVVWIIAIGYSAYSEVSVERAHSVANHAACNELVNFKERTLHSARRARAKTAFLWHVWGLGSFVGFTRAQKRRVIDPRWLNEIPL